MSAIKKGIKKAARFVRKNWKSIALAAAVVLTAGIATVGVAGFGAASAAAGGGIGGFLSAAGSTMAAGVASIGGTLGIGKGAALAKFGGAGYATLGTGAAAQALGLAANPALTAGNLAASAPAAALGGGPPAALAGVGGGGAAGAAGTAAAGGGGFLNSPLAGPLLQAGQGLIGGYMQARQAEEQWDREKPKGYWGVGLNDTPSQAPGAGPSMAWDPQSFISQNQMSMMPRSGFTGNRALDTQQVLNPNVNNPLSPDYDPSALRVRAGYGG